MNRYFIAHYTQHLMKQTGMVYPCLAPKEHSENTVGNIPPAVAFFEQEIHRDRELEAWCQQWPGFRFVTGEITAGMQCQPGPVKAFVVNEKGVLPK